MVWYFVVIGLLTLRLGYELFLDALSIKESKRPIPENVKDVYSEEEYKKWANYDKEKNTLSIVSSIIVYLVSLALLMTYSYSSFASLFGTNYYLSALGVLILYAIPDFVISTIFSYIDTFKIEEKYGFNKSTKKTFVVDTIKSIIIKSILIYGVVALFIALHQAMGVWVIVLFTVIMLLILLFFIFISPKLTRINNKLTPLPEGELRNKLTDLLVRNGYTVKEIQVMDASKRTTKVNAMFAGFGKMKTIILFDTLLEKANDDEILAVFAHELGHGKHKDTLRNYIRIIFIMILFSLATFGLIQLTDLYTDFHFEQVNYGFMFIIFSDIVLGALFPFINMFSNYFSRKMEYSADKFAKDQGYGEALVTGLKKLTKENFGELNPHPIIVKVAYSHPTLSQRIDNIKNEKD